MSLAQPGEPDPEATMIYSDYPVIAHFECVVQGCDVIYPIHGTVDATIVMPPEDDEGDGYPVISFEPRLFADAFEMHMSLDHGLPVAMARTLEELQQMVEGDEDDD